MKNFFSPESRLNRTLSVTGDLMLLNVLFIVFSIPLFTVGASAAALYTVALKIEKKEEPPVRKMFIAAFKENFLKATAIWLILLAAGFLVWTGWSILMTYAKAFPFFIFLIYGLIGFFVLMTAGWVFAVLAKFENTVFRTIKTAFILGMTNPLKGIIITVTTGLIPACFLFLTYWFILFGILWILLGFSAIAVYNCSIFNKVFDRLITTTKEGSSWETI